jgi:hypothetical protein
MATKGRSTPRIVCCAIPIARASGKVLVITSRKRPEKWVCECASPRSISVGHSRCSVALSLPILFHSISGRAAPVPHLAVDSLFADTSICVAVPKGGWEATDRVLEAAASREALEEG